MICSFDLSYVSCNGRGQPKFRSRTRSRSPNEIIVSELFKRQEEHGTLIDVLGRSRLKQWTKLRKLPRLGSIHKLAKAIH